MFKSSVLNWVVFAGCCNSLLKAVLKVCPKTKSGNADKRTKLFKFYKQFDKAFNHSWLALRNIDDSLSILALRADWKLPKAKVKDVFASELKKFKDSGFE